MAINHHEKYCNEEYNQISVIEFFSGIGGLHLSIKNATRSFNSKSNCQFGINLDVIKAFEINEHANITYKKNFPNTLICNKNIESLNMFDIPYADVWLLSPPCQPFTKGGSRKDCDDTRTRPFLKLIDLMESLESHNKLPKAWFVENVANFETSNTHRKMMNMFSKLNFCTFEFMLSPTLIGVPNTRVRYYCVSVRKDSEHLIKQLNELKASIYEKNCQSIASNVLLSHSIKESTIDSNETNEIPTEYLNILCSIPYEKNIITQIIENIPSSINEIILSSDDIDDESFKLLIQLANNIVNNNPSFKFDIVNIHSKASTTFTKSYIETQGRGGPLFDYSENHKTSENCTSDYNTYNHIFNTSILEHQRFQTVQDNSNLRCFHPREILSIMGFPNNWFEGTNLNLKKKYSLIGNSISVHIVTLLLHFMLELLAN